MHGKGFLQSCQNFPFLLKKEGKKRMEDPEMDKLDWLLVVKMPFLDKMESRAQPNWHWTVGTLPGGGLTLKSC